jgi:hypothetical protein
MSILAAITGIIKPIGDIIDNLHTSAEEKGVLKNELARVENGFAEKLLNYEAKMTEMKVAVITAEAAGESWIQRSWRPIAMLTFLTLIVCDSFGWLKNPLASQAWTLLQIGIGGYVAGRTAEKIIPTIMDKISPSKE